MISPADSPKIDYREHIEERNYKVTEEAGQRLIEFCQEKAEKVFLSLLAILWNSAFKRAYLSFSPFPFTSVLVKATCKASSDNRFCFFHFFS